MAGADDFVTWPGEKLWQQTQTRIDQIYRFNIFSIGMKSGASCESFGVQRWYGQALLPPSS
jgi:hypothetical protein